jgi:hypothetical protein
MNQPSGAVPFEKGSFEKACDYCGAHFEVAVSRQSGGNRAQGFACPECGRSYEVRAALPPSVRLISKRTDGKGDRYQETMF